MTKHISSTSSVTAKPMKPIWRNFASAAGLRAMAVIQAEKIRPRPIPAPSEPIIAIPAPSNFAAVGSIENSCFTLWLGLEKLMHFNRVAQIYRRQNSVDISLQERDEKLEAGN